ncbi:MAG: T9SS type A sorting domain-containing protein, partial [Bacteroidia bacterium]|nr:T9SS type A sorting domain-containing protein [Bacteroidia bacterium]
GFTTVFENMISLSTSLNRIQFATPFNWDGTSNLLVEFSFDNDIAAPSDCEIDADTTAGISGVAVIEEDGYYQCNKDGFYVKDAANAFATIDSQITIAFWVKGDAALPLNTTIFEAMNENNERVLNIHLPWSNNSVYWDAGAVPYSGTDRIFKAATTNDIEGKWNHWAFTKNVGTGVMKIYLNGLMWASGFSKTRPMNGIQKASFAKTPKKEGFDGTYPGAMNEIQIWNKELSATTISSWFKKKINPSHPDYANLVCYYPFESDMGFTAEDAGPMNHDAEIVGMPDWQNQKGSNLSLNAILTNQRPVLSFVQGTYDSHTDTSWTTTIDYRPLTTVIKFDDTQNPAVATDTVHVYEAGNYTYEYTNSVKSDSAIVVPENTFHKVMTDYYSYFEKIHRTEIGRFITPYGIGLDLGPDGFTWVYDVTDYAALLTDYVTISAGNTQELLDMKFMFISGTPPRDVKAIQQMYNDMASYSYNNLAMDNQMKADTFQLNSGSSQFKVKTRISGHGHEGIYDAAAGLIHCCEWADKNHHIAINGAATPQINWDLKVNGACATNPVVAQGGNWAPDRDGGWCPSMPVPDREFEITQYVSGQSVVLDYGIEPVPSNNPGQGSGNYVMSMHLIEYGNNNFAVDAAIEDIIKPSKSDIYSNINPICNAPSIRIKNNGSTPLTSATINYGVVGGTPKTTPWFGNLAFGQTVDITLQMGYADWGSSNSSNVFYAEIVNPVSGTDENPDNNIMHSEFVTPPVYPNKMVVRFKNNALSGDINIKIKGANGAIVYVKSNVTANALFNDTVNFATPGCYFMEVTSQEGLGLNYPLIPEVGSGNLGFRDANGALLKQFEADFGKKITHHFTVGFALPIETIADEKRISVFPNPSNGKISVEVMHNFRDMALISVSDVMGRIIHHETVNINGGELNQEVDLSAYPSGVYFITVSDGNLKFTEKVIRE